MSFEHKYLKYKQKYLELKSQLESMQQVGGASNNDSILDLDKLSDTPTNNNSKSFNQLAGYLQDSSEYFKNSETDTDIEEVNELTETPKENTMVVNIDSSTDESNDKESDTDSSDVKQDKTDDSEDDSSSPSEQEGGDLETSISELDEIFSQLGGKKKKEKDSSSENSSLSSLSSLEDSSSDFDF